MSTADYNSDYEYSSLLLQYSTSTVLNKRPLQLPMATVGPARNILDGGLK